MNFMLQNSNQEIVRALSFSNFSSSDYELRRNHIVSHNKVKKFKSISLSRSYLTNTNWGGPKIKIKRNLVILAIISC